MRCAYVEFTYQDFSRVTSNHPFAGAHPRAPGRICHGQRSRLVVWIVDDAISVRKSIAAVLETTVVVRDFGSAREFLADFAPGPGCLILDHHMPDMTGLELLHHLRRRDCRSPPSSLPARATRF